MKLHNIIIYNMLLKPLVGIRLVKTKPSNNKRLPVAGHGFTAARARQRSKLHYHGQNRGYARNMSNNYVYIYIYIYDIIIFNNNNIHQSFICVVRRQVVIHSMLSTIQNLNGKIHLEYK